MALFARKKPVPPPAPEPVVEVPLPERTPDEHAAAVLQGVAPLRPFGMQINDVSGLTLCEDIVSDLDLPMVSTALVEGYGLRAANIVGATGSHPIDLRIMGIVERLDALPSQAVPPGGCMLVAEGAPLPKGVDAVVPLQDAARTGRNATFTFEAKVNQNISRRGSELAEGSTLLAAGSTLDARGIAVLAEVGLDKVLVRPRPRLVVFSVGPDLLAPGLPVTSVSQRYASATSLVTAAAREDGATVYPLDIVGRDAAAIRRTITEQVIRADAMVALVQDEPDAHLVADILGEVGTVDQAHVSLNAGSPMAVGRVGDDRVPVLVVPAGSADAFAAYHLFVRPLLEALGARVAAPGERRSVRLAEGVEEASGTRYVPALLEGDLAAPVTRGRVLAHHLSQADVLLVLPAGRALPEGSAVECVALTGPSASE